MRFNVRYILFGVMPFIAIWGWLITLNSGTRYRVTAALMVGWYCVCFSIAAYVGARRSPRRAPEREPEDVSPLV
jgi:hypothetical protein